MIHNYLIVLWYYNLNSVLNQIIYTTILLIVAFHTLSMLCCRLIFTSCIIQGSLNRIYKTTIKHAIFNDNIIVTISLTTFFKFSISVILIFIFLRGLSYPSFFQLLFITYSNVYPNCKKSTIIHLLSMHDSVTMLQNSMRILDKTLFIQPL